MLEHVVEAEAPQPPASPCSSKFWQKSKNVVVAQTCLDRWDTSGDGEIDCGEMAAALINMVIPSEAVGHISRLVAMQADTDGDGDVEYQEFIDWVSGEKARKKNATEQAKVLTAFKAWDANRDGLVEMPELKTILQHLGLGGPQVTLLADKVFKQADWNCDGHIDFAEFVDWVFHTRCSPRAPLCCNMPIDVQTRLLSGSYTGRKQEGLGPEMWGIGMVQVAALRDNLLFEDGMTLYRVTDEIVKPETAGTGVGYALLINRSRPLADRVMVSHAWDEYFDDLCAALSTCHLNGPFWICALSMYQNQDLLHLTIEHQLGEDLMTGSMATVLKSADMMVAVITQRCNIYTRLWCTFEMFVAVLLSVPVRMAQTISYSDCSGYKDAFADHCREPVASEHGRCTNKDDENRIRQMIETASGYHIVDIAVETERLRAVMRRRWNENDPVTFKDRKLHPGIWQKTYNELMITQLRRIASAGVDALPYIDVLPVLAACLRENEGKVRSTAAQALGFIGDTASEYVELIAHLAVSDQDDAVRHSAAQALGRLSLTSPKASFQVTALDTHLLQDADATTRERAREARQIIDEVISELKT